MRADPAEAQACAVAHPQSLQHAMLVISALYAVTGAFFLLTCRWLRRDMAASGMSA